MKDALELVSEADGWRYLSLSRPKEIPGADVNRRRQLLLAEFDKVDVAGHRTGRLHVDLMLKEFYTNKVAFGYFSRVAVSCFHNIHGAVVGDVVPERPRSSSSYCFKCFRRTIPTNIDGWMEFPIIGPEMRVLIWGDRLPRRDLTLEVTLYLLK